MPSNDLIVLNKVLEQKKSDIAPELPEDIFFEIFVFEQILKNYDLSYDELIAGKSGGFNDGGIDGVFLLIDGNLVEESMEVESIKHEPRFDLYIIQAKRSVGFSESTIDRLNSTSQDLFDLTKNMDTLRSLYNDQVIEKFSLFRDFFLGLARRHPKLFIHFFYVSKGDTNTINLQLRSRKENLILLVKAFFSSSITEVIFLGAKELLDITRKEKKYTLTLKLAENPLSKSPDNYVVLSSLDNYYNFVVDDENNLRKYIFDSNVRDFQGYVEVNKDIHETLNKKDKLDFWWLNNGITILGSKASVAGKEITIDNVQIINGLQTSECIYNYFNPIIESNQAIPKKDSNRSILVKIIIIEDETARDKIIKATNFQTSIPPASLRATERIHYNLEDYFKNYDWYYDRRKNYYKNIGKPISKIISIPFMAQCMMSIIHQEPHSARARPSSLVKKEPEYKKVFDDRIDPRVYLFCSQATRKVENRLRSDIEDYTNQEKTNLKLHIAMVLIMILMKRIDYTIQDVSNLNIDDINDELIDSATDITIQLSRRYTEENSVSLEKSSKSAGLVQYLKESFIL